MDGVMFVRLINEIFDYCKGLLDLKNDEYTSGQDRLYNFRLQSRMLSLREEEVALNLVSKQFASLIEIIKNHREDKYPLLLKEKIPDIINYMALLYAIIKEKNL